MSNGSIPSETRSLVTKMNQTWYIGFFMRDHHSLFFSFSWSSWLVTSRNAKKNSFFLEITSRCECIVPKRKSRVLAEKGEKWGRNNRCDYCLSLVSPQFNPMYPFHPSTIHTIHFMTNSELLKIYGKLTSQVSLGWILSYFTTSITTSKCEIQGTCFAVYMTRGRDENRLPDQNQHTCSLSPPQTISSLFPWLSLNSDIYFPFFSFPNFLWHS